MKISERFVSIQGEGAYAGFVSTFIRLSGCNLHCPWCDTKYSWTGGVDMSVDEIVKYVRESSANIVTITGGEPLLQQDELPELISKLYDQHTIIIETNGTIYPSPRLLAYPIVWSVSPKPQLENYRFNFPEHCISYLKFVARDLDDLTIVEQFLRKFKHPIPVFIQPDGLSPRYEILCKQLWVRISRDHPDWIFRPQLHRLIWGVKRGV